MAVVLKRITEDAFKDQVLDLARAFKWRTAHFRPGLTRSGQWVTAVQGDGKGFPDLVLVRGPTLIVAELKVGRNKPTREQTAWLQAFELAGIPAYTWWPRHWSEIESVLRAA